MTNEEIVLKVFEYGMYLWPLVFIVCCVYAKKSERNSLDWFLCGATYPVLLYFTIGGLPIALGFGIIIGLYYLLIGRGKKDPFDNLSKKVL